MANNKEPSVTERIDTDEGLKSKRKMLTITSLILLALSVSGAKIEEANSFIFNIKFESQSGIGVLLVFSVLFLMVRYFNYAKPYHVELFRLWSDRMMHHPYFLSRCHHSYEASGLIAEKFPNESRFDEVPFAGDDLEETGHEWSYKCFPPFVRKLSFTWRDREDYYDEDVSIGRENYLKVLGLEAKYQFASFFTHRENLDILAPYMLALVAISSYFFKEQFQAFIKILAAI